MKVQALKLCCFRNYKLLDFEPGENLNLFYGKNASGKTNLLEAIYLLTEGKSFKGAADRELITFGEEKSRMEGRFDHFSYEDDYSIQLSRNKTKSFYRNQEIIPSKEFRRNRFAIIFSPVDLNMIKYSPGERRRYLDQLMSHMDPMYDHEMGIYRKLLLERNRLLKSKPNPSLLEIYNREMARVGSKLIIMRLKNIKVLNEFGKRHYKNLSSGDELSMTYLSTISLKGLENRVEEVYLNFLRNAYERDLERRFTTVGPHRDDLDFKINGKSSKLYGSQGEQRSIVLALKLAERDLIKDLYGDDPILLLDDVFSELDDKRSQYLLSSLKGIQTFMTATEIPKIHLKDGEVQYFQINHGEIKTG